MDDVFFPVAPVTYHIRAASVPSADGPALAPGVCGVAAARWVLGAQQSEETLPVLLPAASPGGPCPTLPLGQRPSPVLGRWAPAPQSPPGSAACWPRGVGLQLPPLSSAASPDSGPLAALLAGQPCCCFEGPE